MSSDTNFGTGYYLSSVGGRGGTENFGRIQRGTTQICLKNEDVGGGGIPKVIKSYWGDHFGEATFKGGIG